MNTHDMAINGRRLLFDQYQNHYDLGLKPAIDKFRKAGRNFSDSLYIFNNGGDLQYNLNTHTFERAYIVDKPSFERTSLWERDHVIHCINTFAKELFGFDKDKQECVKAYMYQKLGVLQADEFVLDGKNVNENKIWKFFQKVEDGKLKSCEEKAEKKAYLNSDQYKIDQINEEIQDIDTRLDQMLDNQENIFDNLDDLIGQINERLSRGISDNGKKALGNLLKAFQNLKRGFEQGKSLAGIDFQMFSNEGQSYKNCFPDGVSSEIDKVYHFLERFNAPLTKKINLMKQLEAIQGKREQNDIPVHNPNPFQLDEEDVIDFEPLIEEDDNVIEEGNINQAKKRNENDQPKEKVRRNKNNPKKTSWFSKAFSSIARFFSSIWRWLTK